MTGEYIALAGEKAKSRRGYVEIEAVDPADGRPWTILIADERVKRVRIYGSMGALMDLARIVPAAVQNPTAIFQGIREEQEDTWLCYASYPSHAHNADGASRPPWPGEVFLVFVNEDRVAYNWYWSKADPADAKLPEGYATRFARKVL